MDLEWSLFPYIDEKDDAIHYEIHLFVGISVPEGRESHE